MTVHELYCMLDLMMREGTDPSLEIQLAISDWNSTMVEYAVLEGGHFTSDANEYRGPRLMLLGSWTKAS